MPEYRQRRNRGYGKFFQYYLMPIIDTLQSGNNVCAKAAFLFCFSLYHENVKNSNQQKENQIKIPFGTLIFPYAQQDDRSYSLM